MSRGPTSRHFGFDRYLNIRTAQAPIFSPDGESIAFLSDITGVPQLWQVPIDGGWPDQLSFTEDRISSAHYAHVTPAIVFGMDSGGNEREQLFLLGKGNVSEIAVDPDVLHAFGSIAPDDGRIAFSSNQRHPAYFDVYVANLDGSDRRCVYQQDGSNFALDWSPDGSQILITRLTGPLDAELFLLDLKSSEVTHLTPHAEPSVYRAATFLPDGTNILLITNQDSEYTRLARLDLQTRHLEFLTSDTVDVDEIALSPDGQRVALVRNREGYGCLSILSLDSRDEIPPPQLPDGVVMQPAWSCDSRLLTFAFSAPEHNFNVWIWAVDDEKCRQLTRVACGAIPQETFVAPQLIRFPSFDGLEIPAFLYLPDAECPPVVILIHGGPEGQTRPAFNPVIQYLIHRGYAVLAPNVRGSIGYGRTFTHLDDVEKRMDSVADLRAAATWLQASSRVDGRRIAVMGGSYGGFMVLAALTTYPDLWAAGVDIVGIANLETFLRNTSAYRRHWRIPEYGDPDQHAEFFRRISPIYRADHIRAPLLVLHGDNDPRVPLNEAEQMVEAVQRRGGTVELLRFADEGHGIVKLKNKLVAYPAIGRFLDQHLLSSITEKEVERSSAP